MAAKGERRLGISEHPIKGSANQRKLRPTPGRWPRRSREFGCKTDNPPPLRLIHWEADAKGHYDEASGPSAGTTSETTPRLGMSPESRDSTADDASAV
jgi:hypothetical protein